MASPSWCQWTPPSRPSTSTHFPTSPSSKTLLINVYIDRYIFWCICIHVAHNRICGGVQRDWRCGLGLAIRSARWREKERNFFRLLRHTNTCGEQVKLAIPVQRTGNFPSIIKAK
jgi:hypothetical protein